MVSIYRDIYTNFWVLEGVADGWKGSPDVLS